MEPNSYSPTNPSALPLTLSAEVLRLPYPPTTRLVLAEIVSLHQANRGCCDCSDAHLAARLTIAKDTASVAVQLLVAEGLLAKEVVRQHTGFYRTLTPLMEAIMVKAQANPYPEIPGTRKNTPTRNLPPAYPEIPDALPGNSGSNIPLNITDNSTGKEHAADAATHSTSFSGKGSKKSKAVASKKKAAAQAEEVAALPLPHPGELFAQRWATFRAGPKQAKKPLSAFELMLDKLGKYREGFAVEMLEAAIQGDWSGVENPGTAAKYVEWQAQHPAPRPPASPMGPDFSVEALFGLKRVPVDVSAHLDPEAIAANKARETADMQRRADENRRKREAAAAGQEPPPNPTPPTN